jgi:hypothetical protein
MNRLAAIQQTFVVPVDLTQGDTSEGQRRLAAWLDYAHKLFVRRGIMPTLQDILYLPEDLSLCLSPNPDRAGFAVSYAFEVSGRRKIALVQSLFVETSYALWHEYQGRASLVKNVCADEAILEQMYGADLDDFLVLKTEFDPHCILRNSFLRRTFGKRLEQHYGRPIWP